jgi:dTDP-4-amino-4,6-dideoxygalactose transaminase
MASRKRKPAPLAIDGGTPVKTTPYGSGPKHSLAEWQAIKPLFERGSIQMTRGPEVMQLREAFCKRFNRKYAVTASSGTAALHTAVAALGIGRGDEVITSPITDMGTITAIVQQNAVPVLADVDPLTSMITPETVARCLSPRTRAVIPVHLAGLPCDVHGIKRLVKGRDIGIIEDMAQSYNTRRGKTVCGTIGDVGCWSLNESKHIGAGDGGILLTNNKKIADRADLFADKCYDRTGSGRSPHFAPYNYRLNTLTAAVCLQQLEKVDSICSKRNKLGSALDAALAAIPGITPRPVRRGDYATYWYYLFAIDPDAFTVSPARFREALTHEGVWGGTPRSVLQWDYFQAPPDDPHACAANCPMYKGSVSYALENFPGALAVEANSVQLGISEYYRMRDINDIAKAVAKVAAHYSRA